MATDTSTTANSISVLWDNLFQCWNPKCGECFGTSSNSTETETQRKELARSKKTYQREQFRSLRLSLPAPCINQKVNQYLHTNIRHDDSILAA